MRWEPLGGCQDTRRQDNRTERHQDVRPVEGGRIPVQQHSGTLHKRHDSNRMYLK